MLPSRSHVRLGATALALTALSVPLSAQQHSSERYTLRGDKVAVYNLVGTMRVEGGGGGGDVQVEVRLGGRDAGDLKVETGEIRSRQTLRVLYPDDDIRVSRDADYSGSTTLDVRADGTFGDGGSSTSSSSGGWTRDDDDDDDDDDRRARRRSSGDRRRVRISSRGAGVEAYADVTLRVPEGRSVAVYLGVGEATVSNVNGNIVVDVAAASVTAERTRGSLNIDTGSGSIDVTDAQGEVNLDTGSGSVRLRGVRGPSLLVDTGSGGVTGDGIEVEDLNVDVGSGSVRLTNVRAPMLRVDTGSGGVEVSAASGATARTWLFDTGSGGVTLRVPSSLAADLDISTGSGGISTDLPISITRQSRTSLRGRLGDGGDGRIKIDTGSGGVRLVRS